MLKRLWPIVLLLAGCGRPTPDPAATPAAGTVLPPAAGTVLPPAAGTVAPPLAAPPLPVPPPMAQPTKPTPVPTAPTLPTPAVDDVANIDAAKTIKAEMVSTTSFSLSPDVTVVGITGIALGTANTYRSDYYETATGKKIGQLPGLVGPGTISDRRTTTYKDSSFEPGSDLNEPNIDFFSRDIVSDKQSLVLQIKKVKQPHGKFVPSPDGSMIVRGLGSELTFLKLPGGKPAFPAVTTDSPILTISGIYSAGTRLATLHDRGLIRIWDLTTGLQTDTLDLGRATQEYESLLVAEDGRAMLVKNDKGETVCWDLKAKKFCKWVKDGHRSEFQPLSGGVVCYNETYYKIAPYRNCIMVADMETGKVRERLLLPADDKQIWLFTKVSDDGKRVACFSADTQTVYYWERHAAK